MNRLALLALATPPHFHRPLLDWVLVAVAMIGPWVWLVVIEKRLARKS